MRTTIALDDEEVKEAMEYTGIQENLLSCVKFLLRWCNRRPVAG